MREKVVARRLGSDATEAVSDFVYRLQEAKEARASVEHQIERVEKERRQPAKEEALNWLLRERANLDVILRSLRTKAAEVEKLLAK